MSNGSVIGSSFDLRRCEEPSCGAADRFATTTVDPGSGAGTGSRVGRGEDPLTLDERHLAPSLGDLPGRVREHVAVDHG